MNDILWCIFASIIVICITFYNCVKVKYAALVEMNEQSCTTNEWDTSDLQEDT